MTGKRAKPSPWRFVRLAPVAVVTVAVWVIVGLFLLLPGSGTDGARDWALDPIPSNSDDEAPADPDSSRAASPTPSEAAPSVSHEPTTTSEGAAPQRNTAGDLDLTGASASAPTAQSRPRATSDPTEPTHTDNSPGPPAENPGKKKGHDKPHGHPRP